MPASTPGRDFSTPIDTTAANDTGLALVNPPSIGGISGQAVATVTMRLYDNDFNLLGTRSFEMAEGRHVPRFVTQDDFFGEVAGIDEMTGSVTIESSSPIAAVVLLQDDDPAVSFPADVPILTALPISPGRADTSGPITVSR